MSEALLAAVRARYPQLAPTSLPAEGLQTAVVDSGTVLFEQHTPCRAFPFVLSGEVRVASTNADGRSLELYRVGTGEMCVVSATCLYGERPLTAQGVATMPTELVLLTGATLLRWMNEPAFRHFVFSTMADRLADLMALAEAVAFQRLDRRLAALLVARAPRVRGTHQDLADELGTVREIVSRLIGRFERHGWLLSRRGEIEVLDTAALQALATDVLASS